MASSDASIKDRFSRENLLSTITNGLSLTFSEELRRELSANTNVCDFNVSEDSLAEGCKMTGIETGSSGIGVSEICKETVKNLAANGDYDSHINFGSNQIKGEFILTNFQDDDSCSDNLEFCQTNSHLTNSVCSDYEKKKCTFAHNVVQQFETNSVETIQSTRLSTPHKGEVSRLVKESSVADLNFSSYISPTTTVPSLPIGIGFQMPIKKLNEESRRNFEVLNSATGDSIENTTFNESKLNFRSDQNIPTNRILQLYDPVRNSLDFNANMQLSKANPDIQNDSTSRSFQNVGNSVLKHLLVGVPTVESQRNSSISTKLCNAQSRDSISQNTGDSLTSTVNKNLTNKIDKRDNAKITERNGHQIQKTVTSMKSNVHFSSPDYLTKKFYKCRKCNMIFHSIWQRKAHGIAHRKKSLLKCTECNKWFTNSESFELHRHVHSNVQLVHEKITKENGGKHHEHIHQWKKQISLHKSPVLNNETTHQKTLSGNPALYACDLYNEKFCSERTLEYQRDAVHKLNLKCCNCDQNFKDSDSLKLHREECSGNFVTHSGLKINKEKEFDDECHTECNNIPILPSANRDVETNISDLYPGFVCTYKCKECGKKFCVKEEFKSHVIAHLMKRDLKCEHCNEFFQTSLELESHEKKHEKRTMKVPDKTEVYSGVKSNISVSECKMHCE